jgi:hypothetical protein
MPCSGPVSAWGTIGRTELAYIKMINDQGGINGRKINLISLKVTIGKAQSDTSRGIIHYRAPVASALLGAEEGDEVEVLVGSFIRRALIESISKSVDPSVPTN